MFHDEWTSKFGVINHEDKPFGIIRDGRTIFSLEGSKTASSFLG